MWQYGKHERLIAAVILVATVPSVWALYVHSMNTPDLPEKEIWVPDPAVYAEFKRPWEDDNYWMTYRSYYNLGFALATNGRVVDGAKMFRYCIDKAPVGSLPWAKSCLMMAVISESVGDFDNANKFYARYVIGSTPFVGGARTVVDGAWREVRRKTVPQEADNKVEN